MRKKYVLECPFCSWHQKDTSKVIIPEMKKNLALHLIEEHVEEVSKWYENNSKSWSYIRRKVLNDLMLPVGFTLDGRIRELEKIESPKMFINKLHELLDDLSEEESLKSAIVGIALLNALGKIGLYYVKHNINVVEEG